MCGSKETASEFKFALPEGWEAPTLFSICQYLHCCLGENNGFLLEAEGSPRKTASPEACTDGLLVVCLPMACRVLYMGIATQIS